MAFGGSISLDYTIIAAVPVFPRGLVDGDAWATVCPAPGDLVEHSRLHPGGVIGLQHGDSLRS